MQAMSSASPQPVPPPPPPPAFSGFLLFPPFPVPDSLGFALVDGLAAIVILDLELWTNLWVTLVADAILDVCIK
jgi:hypothetical protein